MWLIHRRQRETIRPVWLRSSRRVVEFGPRSPEPYRAQARSRVPAMTGASRRGWRKIPSAYAQPGEPGRLDRRRPRSESHQPIGTRHRAVATASQAIRPGRAHRAADRAARYRTKAPAQPRPAWSVSFLACGQKRAGCSFLHKRGTAALPRLDADTAVEADDGRVVRQRLVCGDACSRAKVIDDLLRRAAGVAGVERTAKAIIADPPTAGIGKFGKPIAEQQQHRLHRKLALV